MLSTVYLSAVLAGITSLLSPFFWRSLLLRLGTFDLPNYRSSHSQKTLRGGGIGALSGIVVAVIFLIFFIEEDYLSPLFIIFLTGILVGIIGLIEDLKGLRSSIRALSQLIIGLGLGITLWQYFDSVVWWIPAVTIFFAANVNFTNFMDGVNGISSIHGIVVGGIFAVIGLSHDMTWVVVAGITIVFSFGAFLPWNLIPPHMFLGDVGSYLLGGLTASISLTCIFAGVNPVLAFAPLSIYWLDTVTTLMRRLISKEPIFNAHRMHIYQRMTDLNLSHLRVAIVVGSFTLLVSLTALIIFSIDVKGLWLSGLFLVLEWILYLLLPSFLNKKLEVEK